MKLWVFALFLSPLATATEQGTLVSVEEITQISPEMIQFLEEHIPPNASKNEKLLILVKLIFNKDFLDLAYDSSHTKTARETFASRSGNCLSFTNMFVVMARHVGLRARFQEVRNLPNWDRHGRVVVLNRHINVQVQIRDRKITVDFNPYEEHRQIWTDLVQDNRAYAQFYNNFGAEAFGSGNNQLSIKYFKRSIEIEPKMSFSHTNLGVVYSNMGEHEKAEASYLKALSISRNDMTANNNLAALYRKMGESTLAEKYQKKANSFRKKNPYYHFSLGNNAFQNENYEAAVTHFKRAIRRKQEEHQFYFALAKAYAYLGRMEKATDSLKKAEVFAPDVFDRERYSQKLEMMAIR